MKLFFPDSLWNPTLISGSSFLYFHNEKIGVTSHPSISTYLTGVDPSSFISFIEKKAPPWRNVFLQFINDWKFYRKSLKYTNQLLEPLRSDSFFTIHLVYNRGSIGWNDSETLLKSSKMKLSEIVSLIDPFHACDEFFAHIFFEKVFDARFGELSVEKRMDIVRNIEKTFSGPEDLRKDFDWMPIYKYCDELFSKKSKDELLAQAYMFRMPIVKEVPVILLSNPNLISFFRSLPVSLSKKGMLNDKIDEDVISWEIFRQLVSFVIDPLDDSKIQLVLEMKKNRVEEIDRLKKKCLELSLDLSDEKKIEKLLPRVKNIIKAKVSGELNELIKIDKKAFKKLLTEIFSDEKTWMSISAIMLGLTAGKDVISAGAAIYGLSTFGAKALKEALNRREELSTNSYTLIYRMNNRK